MAQGPAIQNKGALESDGNLEALLKAVIVLTEEMLLLRAEMKELREFLELQL